LEVIKFKLEEWTEPVELDTKSWIYAQT